MIGTETSDNEDEEDNYNNNVSKMAKSNSKQYGVPFSSSFLIDLFCI
jgi:hypothetical protein